MGDDEAIGEATEEEARARWDSLTPDARWAAYLDAFGGRRQLARLRAERDRLRGEVVQLRGEAACIWVDADPSPSGKRQWRCERCERVNEAPTHAYFSSCPKARIGRPPTRPTHRRMCNSCSAPTLGVIEAGAWRCDDCGDGEKDDG